MFFSRHAFQTCIEDYMVATFTWTIDLNREIENNHHNFGIYKSVMDGHEEIWLDLHQILWVLEKAEGGFLHHCRGVVNVRNFRDGKRIIEDIIYYGAQCIELTSGFGCVDDIDMVALKQGPQRTLKWEAWLRQIWWTWTNRVNFRLTEDKWGMKAPVQPFMGRPLSPNLIMNRGHLESGAWIHRESGAPVEMPEDAVFAPRGSSAFHQGGARFVDLTQEDDDEEEEEPELVRLIPVGFRNLSPVGVAEDIEEAVYDN